MASALFDPLFDPAGVGTIFADTSWLQAMLDFEAALARAEAACGFFPGERAESIARCCRAGLFEPAEIGRRAPAGGNPAIPLVAALVRKVAAEDPEAARYVHFGATSQDVIDTALVLLLRRVVAFLEEETAALAAVLADLAATHRDTPMVARTFLQHAVPTTFGCKVAGWLDALLRQRRRLAEIRGRLLVVQFGGAAGTLAALGAKGPAVAARLAALLELDLPAIPWHAHRDRPAEFAAWLALLATGLGKMARDVALMTQTEVAELAEPGGEGRGGSSTMPQKRNPVACILVLAAAGRAPALAAGVMAGVVQEHERGLGGWHAEWRNLPELCVLACGALRRMREACAGLRVDADRMRRNLDRSGGLVMAEAVQTALLDTLGRAAARERLAAACARVRAEGADLRELLAADPEIGTRLSEAELAALFEPTGYLGSAPAFVERVLARHRRECGDRRGRDGE